MFEKHELSQGDMNCKTLFCIVAVIFMGLPRLRLAMTVINDSAMTAKLSIHERQSLSIYGVSQFMCIAQFIDSGLLARI